MSELHTKATQVNKRAIHNHQKWARNYFCGQVMQYYRSTLTYRIAVADGISVVVNQFLKINKRGGTHMPGSRF